MQKISFVHSDLNMGFWHEKQKMISETSIYSVYNRFVETGRFEALKCELTDGKPVPHIFWDSDVAKWIESASYLLMKQKNEELERIIDEAVDLIAEKRDENGYFNSHFLVVDTDLRWKHREDHELYCAGHLIEAAVAYAQATGKRKFLSVMEDYAQYIYRVFVTEKSAAFTTPGHEEIELALIKLYDFTQNETYLDLCKFFINNRGLQEEREYSFAFHRYTQSHLPVREQTTAEGHAVRQLYLLCGMADLCVKTKDEALFHACDTIFDNIARKRMYVTGGVGSSRNGEAFTVDYDLPNMTAYSESCAAIALAWFAHRMTLLHCDGKYADVAERAIYNNVLSAISLDGKSFFYENPLEIRTDYINKDISVRNKDVFPITQRKEVFDCSCCPPNITRFIASIGDFLYSADESRLYVHHYMNGTTSYNGISIAQTTDYPNDGRVLLTVNHASAIAVRIPGWCRKYTIRVNGQDAEFTLKNNYAYMDLQPSDQTIELLFDMQPQIVYPSQNIRECTDKVAVQRGPIVYCAEGVDNACNIHTFMLDRMPSFELTFDRTMGAYVMDATGRIPEIAEDLYSFAPPRYARASIRLIPYYAFANRGQSDMTVYLHQ